MPPDWHKKLLVLSIVYAVLCLTVLLFPRHGSPEFRYTGSDPSYEVWNLGFPAACFIYDDRVGFAHGPSVYIAIVFLIMSMLFVLMPGFFFGHYLDKFLKPIFVKSDNKKT